MYLKKIEIQGFKSFADKTEIEFTNDITAIVGPNGSGKSNISDAIRWVLGEQSAKSLRGSKMEDIIFSGTDKRRPLGFAEVSIFFDNKDKHIPLDYGEIAVTRRMFRSGESEFYINKNSCRLKDIRELFMDTGIGKDGYSIIGQGRIDEILSDRPEDRRSIFEEAAGIVKYKNKKEATEKKLSDTEDNLIRIKDLIQEISNQKESLEIEAHKAKEFTSFYDELKVLEVNLYIGEIRKLENQIEAIQLEIEKDNKEISTVENMKIKLEEKFNLFKNKITDMDNEVEISRASKFQLMQVLEREKSQMKLLKEKEGFNKKDKERLEMEIDQTKESIGLLDERVQNLEAEKKVISEKYDKALKLFESKDEELSNINHNLSEKEQQLEEAKSRVISIYNDMSDKRSQLNSIESFHENIDKRLIQLNKEINIIQEGKNKSQIDLDILMDNEKKLKESLGQLTLEKTKYIYKEKKHTESLNDIDENIKSIQIKLQGFISSYNLYKNMEEGYEGYYRSVKNLLNSIKKSRLKVEGYIGLVANLLKVEKEYEKAIDISLGSTLQNVVTQTEKDAKLMINFLKNNNMGRVTFLPLASIKGNPININLNNLKDQGVLGLGHELVKYEDKYKKLFEYLLGRTIIVDNLDNGIKLANRFNHNYRIVTLDGDILNPGGSLTGGSYNNNAISLISRKNKINQLKDEIEDCKGLLNQLEQQKREISKEYDINSEKIISLEGKIKEIEFKIIQGENERETFLKEDKRLGQEILKNKVDIEDLTREVEGFSIRKSKYLNELEILDNKSIEVKKNIEILTEDIRIQKEYKDNFHREVVDTRLSLNNIENKLDNLNEELKASIKEKEDRILALVEKTNMVKSINGILEEISYEKVKLLKSIEIKEQEELETSEQLEVLIVQKEELMKEFYDIQNTLKEVNERLSSLEREKNQRDLKLSKFTLKNENYNNRLLEDYELDYNDAIKLENDSIDIAKSKPRISELKTNIKKLGNVNLGSIEDYTMVKERLDFLEKQHNDLIDSKENLSKLIRDMEKKMRENFMKSFEEINENFSKVFSELFNGGVATLELDPEEDILKTGIEIKVQPPGKRLQNINLLSGGEKSLTAVALLFAILELKPAPFCILDEIDAALDDANIGRYTSYLKKFNNETQFILITHRKTTMEISNVLYGVTMVEEGISRLLSVKIKDYMKDLVS